MSLRVPLDQVALIKKWLELPSEEIEKFSAALEKVGPQFNADELARTVATQSELPNDLILDVIQMLVSLYRTSEPEMPIETFLDREVKPSLIHANTFSDGKEEAEWKTLRKFLLHALSLERIIGTTAKAGIILTEHERIFAGARIMTDIRPIFHIDVSEKPNAAVIVHMLKITQRNPHRTIMDTYFALDSNDIALLKEILERAMKKEQTLRKAMNDSGVTILDVKAFY
jgi:hypothetical protein